MNDLLNNPDAPRPSRRNGTTSSGAVGFPAYTERTYEFRQRRAEIAAIQNPPEDETARRWRLHEEQWKAREAKWAEDEQRKQAALRAADRARLEAVQREAQRLKKVADYKRRELLLARLIDSYQLSEPQKSVLHQRLVNSGDPTNLELAEMVIAELLANPQSAERSCGASTDWRFDDKTLAKQSALARPVKS